MALLWLALATLLMGVASDSVVRHPFGTRSFRTNNRPGSIPRKNKTVVIGIGSGRCGTLSLANLLNKQPHTRVTHEVRECRGLEWDDGPSVARRCVTPD